MVAVVLTVSGCATLQSPKVLKKGEQSITIGAAALFPLDDGAWFDVYLLPRLSDG